MTLERQASAASYQDSEGSAAVEEMFELWSKMSRSEADQNRVSTLRFDAMLNRLELCVSQLIKNVDKVPIWAHAESILSYAKMWAGQTRKIVRNGLRSMMSRLEAVHRAIDDSERCWRQLRVHVAELHEYKRKLEETLPQRVSRADFDQEKAEADQRLSAASATISSLRETVAILKNEKIDLEATMQVPFLVFCAPARELRFLARKLGHVIFIPGMKYARGVHPCSICNNEGLCL